jgi:hypothetical protein
VATFQGTIFASILAALVLRNGPNAKLSEESREGGGLVVRVEATGVGKHPGVAAAKQGLLETDASVFDTGDDAVRVNTDKRDDGRAPASDFGLEAPAACAKFVVRQFIRARGGALDDVGDAVAEVKKQRSLKRGEEARCESTAVKGRPEAIARAAEVAADGGGVEPGVDAGEENDQVFCCQIRDDLVARSKDLGFAGFPGSAQCLNDDLSPMRTAGPAARPALAFFKLRTNPLDMLSPCFGLFYGRGPADPFIARERRNVFPCGERGLIGRKGFPQIRRDFVHDAAGDCFFRHAEAEGSLIPFAVLMTDHVNDYGAGKNQYIILT